jgi:hypothetical protein
MFENFWDELAKSRRRGTGLFSKKTRWWIDMGIVPGEEGTDYVSGIDELGKYIDKTERKRKGNRNLLLILGGVLLYNYVG